MFPNAVPATGYSWYRSSPTIGDYETYVARDLVDTIDATYRTIADADSRAVASITGNDQTSLGSGANGDGETVWRASLEDAVSGGAPGLRQRRGAGDVSAAISGGAGGGTGGRVEKGRP